MDTNRYEICYAANEVSKQLVPSWSKVEWTNKIKVYLESVQHVTAKDLLSMFLPFGCVFSVQTFVNNGNKYGMVHYDTADEAAVALREIRSSTTLLVVQVGIREVRKGRKDKRPRPPPCPPQRSFSYMPLQRLPWLWNPLFPACRQTGLKFMTSQNGGMKGTRSSASSHPRCKSASKKQHFAYRKWDYQHHPLLQVYEANRDL